MESSHFFSKGQEESDSLSDEQSSSHEDAGTDYVDSDQSDIEEFLNSEEVELPQSTLLKVYLALYPKETEGSLKLSMLYKK